MHYAGIDHHRQYSHITLLDEKGEVVRSGRVANLRRELEKSLLLLREDEEEEGSELSQSGDSQALADHYLPDIKREPSLHSL